MDGCVYATKSVLAVVGIVLFSGEPLRGRCCLRSSPGVRDVTGTTQLYDTQLMSQKNARCLSYWPETRVTSGLRLAWLDSFACSEQPHIFKSTSSHVPAPGEKIQVVTLFVDDTVLLQKEYKSDSRKVRSNSSMKVPQVG